MALLTVAIVGREHGNAATLRPMAASESMSDEQARTVADNTVRVYEREYLARHAANLEALTCPNLPPKSGLAVDIEDVKKNLPPVEDTVLVATGTLTRNGPVWLLPAHYRNFSSLVYELHVRDGELLVCNRGTAPTP